MRGHAEIPVLLSREEALRRRALREAWLLIGVGVIVPVIALGGAGRAVVAWRARPLAAAATVAVGLAVFVVRLVLFVS